MKYLIGIDGGGTKSKCVVADSKLNLIHERIGDTSAFLTEGVDVAVQNIFNLIIACVDESKINFRDISSIVLGTTGAGRSEDAKKFEDEFLKFVKSKNITINSFYVESDARIALEGAFSGGPGSILIAGTGSIIFGKDNTGKIYRAGGFGRYIGDEGSGYSIGRQGLIAVAKSYDGRGSSTILTKFIKDNYGVTDEHYLISRVYNQDIDIAAFAPFVIRGAEEGDKECLKILNDESEELLLHIKAMTNCLRDKGMDLCLMGGAISNENYYSLLLREKIQASFPGIKIKKPDHPPEIGALFLAKEKFNE